MEERYQSSGGGFGFLIGAVLVIVVAVGLVFGWQALQVKVSANQAQTAQAQAEQQRWQAVQEQYKADIVRVQEQGHSERWEAWLLSMSQVRADVTAVWPIVLVAVLLWSLVLIFVLRERR